MPIIFDSRAPTDETQRVAAAQIAAITIDNRTPRILVEIEYGSMVNGKFLRNLNVSTMTYAIGSADTMALGMTPPLLPQGTMYDNIKQMIWAWLLKNSGEKGVLA